MADWDFGSEGKKDSKEEDSEVIFSDEDIGKLLEQTLKIQQESKSNSFNCLIVGADGSGKSGVVMDYISRLPKKTVIIDLDGGNMPLYESYYKGKESANKIIIVQPMEIKPTATDIEIDYSRTLAKIKAIVKYVKTNYTEFGAIVLDGLSTLLKNAEYIMRIEKNIAPDGGVQLRYWINRAKTFTEIIEMMKSIPVIDKFYIAHEDFILKENDSSVKQKMNQTVHQRIICKKNINLDKVEFVAIIDKSKYNIKIEGKEYIFATVNTETKEFTWNAQEIFKGLK